MRKKVLFAAFESLPFVKTGGLADVMYALPRAIDEERFDVKVVLPLLKTIKEKYNDKLKYVDSFNVNSGLFNEETKVYSFSDGGIDFFFIDNNRFFDRNGVYGFDDDDLRFSYYNLAIVEMMIKLDYYPDIIHCHDYHTGLVAALCKLRYKNNEGIKKIKHIFTIHNLIFQGSYKKNILTDYLGFDYKDYENGTLRYNDECNFMKIAIVMSDVITTVSRTYAKEIQGIENGQGLDAILSYRKDDLYGIVNGIDCNLFNPSKDDIFKKYSLTNFTSGKSLNKMALQHELGLNEDKDTFLVGIVTRLTHQKGVDLLLDSVEEMLKNNVQLVVLGSGESRYEYGFKAIEEKYKGQLAFVCGYNEKLAHSIYAGLDLFVMPSRFEPCGISQLIAMRYGTLPLVRETGGLKDTVVPYNEYTKEGRGFSFGPFDKHDFLHVFNYAYNTFKDKKDDWNTLIENAMKYDVSFMASAKKYEELYNKI